MNKCMVCGKDSGKGKTCGSTCRSKLARSVAKGVAKPDNATVEVEPVATVDELSDMPRQQLMLEIRSYPQDTWKDSPEFAELMRRLKTRTIEELEVGGYWIPMWKINEIAA